MSQCMYTNFGGWSLLVSEILLLSKTAKFPFPTMDYSPWSSKNLIDWNWLKKIHASMHTNFGSMWDITCQVYVHINFDGCVAILVSEILLLSKTAKFPFPTMDYSPWSSKNLIIWNRLKKFMQVEFNISSACTPILMGVGLILVSEILLLSKTAKFPFPTMDYSPWSSKNLIV